MFFVLECPKFSRDIYRSPDVKILFSANITITEASLIPFATILRQEIQLITDPKNGPRMPWDSSSVIGGGKIFFANWNDMDDDKTKIITNLPIDQNFKSLARIYGRVENSEHFITHDCPLDDINTKRWQCLVNTDRFIESIQVCDGNPDCTMENVDWLDESDEAPERCKGANNRMIAISKLVNITCLVIGYILSVAYLPIGASKTMWSAVRTDTRSRNDDATPCDLDPETFKSLFVICNQFEEWNNDNVGEAPSWTDLVDITNRYKSLHEIKDFKQISAIYSCLQGFSKKQSFKYTSMAIAEHLIQLEHETLHSEDSPDEGNRCVKKTVSVNLGVAKFVIESREQNDFLTKMKRCITTKFNTGTCTQTMMWLTLLSTVSAYIVKTVMPYYDSHLDATLAVALHHIETFFITSESKEEEISYISLTITKYYYFLVSILNTIVLSLLFCANLSILQQSSESILFSQSNFGKTTIGKIFSFIPIVFPYHFMGLEYVRLKYRNFKKIKEMDDLLKLLQSKGDIDNVSEETAEFMGLHKQFHEISKYKTELRRIIIASFMLNLLIEGLPQLIVMTSLLVTELGNEHGFGKLRSIFENILSEYIGMPGNRSFIVMLVLQVVKIVLSLNVIVSSETYGIGSDLVASLIKLLELFIMVPVKLVLLTLQLYQAPYVFTLVTMAEFFIAFLYCKVTQENVNLIQDVVPVTITPVLFLFTRGNVLRIKENVFRKKLACLARLNGAHNVVVLHLLNLVLIYIPVKLVLPDMLPNVEEDWGTGYLCALGAYVSSLVPFLCLEVAYFKFGRRWKVLESTNEVTTIEDVQMIQIDQ